MNLQILANSSGTIGMEDVYIAKTTSEADCTKKICTCPVHFFQLNKFINPCLLNSSHFYNLFTGAIYDRDTIQKMSISKKSPFFTPSTSY